MKTQSIAKLQEGDIIRYKDGRSPRLAYVSGINTDSLDRIIDIEVLKILPMNSDPSIIKMLGPIMQDGKVFRQYDGNALDLHSNHTSPLTKEVNQWIVIGTSDRLRLDGFAVGGEYSLATRVHDQTTRQNLENLMKEAERQKYQSTRSGLARLNPDAEWSGGSVNKGFQPREADPYNRTQIAGEEKRKPRAAKAAGEALSYDLALDFCAASFGMPKDFVGLFMNPENPNVKPLKTLQQLYQVAQNPNDLQKYLPESEASIHDVFSWMTNDNPEEERLKNLALYCFDYNARDEHMDPITEWSDLIGFVRDAMLNDEVMKELKDYIGDFEEIPYFLLQMDDHLKEKTAAYEVPLTYTTTAKMTIDAARKQFMTDIAESNQNRYIHKEEESVTVELIPPRKALGSQQEKTIKSSVGRSQTVDPGTNAVMRLPGLYYRLM